MGEVRERGTLKVLGEVRYTRGPPYDSRPHEFYIFEKPFVLAFIGDIDRMMTTDIRLSINN